MRKPKAKIVRVIDRVPTVDDEPGMYVVVLRGAYFGHYYVGRDWTRRKFVSSADPRDGFPWH